MARGGQCHTSDALGDNTQVSPVRAPAPGQSAVFYRGGFVFGGGFIATAE